MCIHIYTHVYIYIYIYIYLFICLFIYIYIYIYIYTYTYIYTYLFSHYHSPVVASHAHFLVDKSFSFIPEMIISVWVSRLSIRFRHSPVVATIDIGIDYRYRYR